MNCSFTIHSIVSKLHRIWNINKDDWEDTNKELANLCQEKRMQQNHLFQKLILVYYTDFENKKNLVERVVSKFCNLSYKEDSNLKNLLNYKKKHDALVK